MMGGYMGYGGLLGIIYMFVPLLILGAIIYWAVRAGTQNSTPGARQKPQRRPLEIAEERYARGEISAEELEEIRRNLQKK